MRTVPVALTVPLPTWLYRPARWAARAIRKSVSGNLRQNLLGDRDIEWSWVAAHLPQGPGQALDFGNGGSPLSLMATLRGFRVTAVDVRQLQWPYAHERLSAVEGDVLEVALPEASFDLVLNCSTVEHVGLAGRYGIVNAQSDGDLRAMARLRELLKPGGAMLMTVPVGQDAVFTPMCRVYGSERLPRLTSGYEIEEQTFWNKDSNNRWVVCERDEALAVRASAGSSNPLHCIYALGCFVLYRPR